MLLPFDRRFAPFVREGTKSHTIRERRKQPFRVGARLDMYVDSRKQSMALLRRSRCEKLQAIEISLGGVDSVALLITIDGVRLSGDEAEKFAWSDGFRNPGRASLQQMRDFWLELDRVFPWTGDLISWDPKVTVEKPAKRRRAAKGRKAA